MSSIWMRRGSFEPQGPISRGYSVQWRLIQSPPVNCTLVVCWCAGVQSQIYGAWVLHLINLVIHAVFASNLGWNSDPDNFVDYPRLSMNAGSVKGMTTMISRCSITKSIGSKSCEGVLTI